MKPTTTQADLTASYDCALCSMPSAPVIEPDAESNGYPLYCSLCTVWIPVKSGNPVRIALQEALGLAGLALAQALQDTLVNCPCGGRFSHDAGKRCYDCLAKVDKQIRTPPPPKSKAIYDPEKLKRWESQLLGYIMQKLETREESLASLIEKYEAGSIDVETYMDGLQEMRRREFKQVAVVQAWAMMLGPDAFRAAEDLELVERYGSRIIVSIASALEMSTGTSVLNTLTREAENWDGQVRKEIKIFLAKTAGGGIAGG